MERTHDSWVPCASSVILSAVNCYTLVHGLFVSYCILFPYLVTSARTTYYPSSNRAWGWPAKWRWRTSASGWCRWRSRWMKLTCILCNDLWGQIVCLLLFMEYQAAYSYTQAIAFIIFYPFMYLWSGSDFNGIIGHKARTFLLSLYELWLLIG